MTTPQPVRPLSSTTTTSTNIRTKKLIYNKGKSGQNRHEEKDRQVKKTQQLVQKSTALTAGDLRQLASCLRYWADLAENEESVRFVETIQYVLQKEESRVGKRIISYPMFVCMLEAYTDSSITATYSNWDVQRRHGNDFQRILNMRTQNADTGRFYAEKAEAVLREVLRRYQDDANKEVGEKIVDPPNAKNFFRVINAHSKQVDNSNMDYDGAARAEDLLQLSWDVHQAEMTNPRAKTKTCIPRPDRVAYTMCIDAWSRRGNGKRAEALLRQMEAGDVHMKPDTTAYNSVIAAWARSHENLLGHRNRRANDNAARNAERILHEMIDRCLNFHHENRGDKGRSGEVADQDPVRPNAISFCTVMDAWAKSAIQPQGMERCLQILSSMEAADPDNVGAEESLTPQPIEACYRVAIHGYSRLGRPELAEEVLRRLVNRMYQQDATSLVPQLPSFNAVINAWAKDGNARRAHDILTLMEQLSGVIEPATSKVDFSPFCTPAHEKLLEIRPDVVTYNTVLDAWSRSLEHDAAKQAEALLERMEQSGPVPLKSKDVYPAAASPNRISYHTVIAAWANKSSHHYDSSQRQNWRGARGLARTFQGDSPQVSPAERAERILRRMEEVGGIKPTSVGYNACISAWSTSGRRIQGQRAHTLLSEMEELYRKAKQAQNTDVAVSDPLVVPDTISYSTVIDAYAKTGTVEGAYRANELLWRMMELYRTRENVYAVPNVVTYNSVCNGWSKSGVLDPIGAKRNRRDSAIDPTVLGAVNAEKILNMMERRTDPKDVYDGAQHVVPPPDIVTYATVINAWGRSLSDEKAERARSILCRMRERNGVQPNHITYNAVLNACAYLTSRHGGVRQRALDIAKTTLREMREEERVECRPDDVSYGTFLRACARLVDSPRLFLQVGKAVFEQCCQEGMVGTMVLQLMDSRIVTEALVDGGHVSKVSSIHGEISEEDLPPEWTRNVSKTILRRGINSKVLRMSRIGGRRR